MVAFDALLEQIDAFIRKYYKNEIVRGILLFLVLFLVSFMLVTGLEYIGRFGSLTRGLLLFSFIAANLGILGWFIVRPLLKLYSFGDRIDRLQASDIIGSFFPNVNDRLKNTLQLQESIEEQAGNIELLRASVAQRSNELAVVPFASAIDIGANRKYLKFILPVLFVFVVIAVFIPSVFTDGTTRVVNYSKEFKIVAPFKFLLLTDNLSLVEGQDLDIKLKLEGRALPDKVYILGAQGKMLLERTAKNVFVGKIQNVRTGGRFLFEANGFKSDSFEYEVKGKSVLGKLDVQLRFPSYLQRADESVNNAGDLVVPEGTVIEWSGLAKNTKRILFKIGDREERFDAAGFSLKHKANDNLNGGIMLFNAFKTTVDTVNFQIQVVRDNYPTIQVSEKQDSVKAGVRYFRGEVGDDYGLTGLVFTYKIKSGSNERMQKLSVKPVSGTFSSFDFAVDFTREDIKVNDIIEYYFSVSDNDGVNGRKSSRSQVFLYKLPSKEELVEERREDQEKAANDIKQLLEQTKDFEKKIEDFKKSLLNNKSSKWNNQNQLNQLKEEHQSIMEQLQMVQQNMQQSLELKNQLSPMDKELLEKNELLNKLLEELMDDEMRSLLEELQKLLEEKNTDEMREHLDKLELNSEDMNKQLDRSLEMMKKMQLDEMVDDVSDQLKQLAKEQEKLSQDLENKNLSKEDAQNKQESINDKFEQLKDDLKALEELNKELDDNLNLDGVEELQNQIKDKLQEASDKMKAGAKSKAKESQKGASEKMDELADKLQNAKEEANEQAQGEDMDMLRDILESLVKLSIDQEATMLDFSKVKTSDPFYRSLGRVQRNIIDNTGPIRDSLYALAKRQPKIASFIDDELRHITTNQKLCIEDIDERRLRELGVHQQMAMASYNNLALMLNESLEQMQKQMQQQANGEDQKPGSGSCNNPGGSGSPKMGGKTPGKSPGDMKEMLKKQLEAMEKGKNSGGKKPGDQQGEGMFGFSNQQIAKMAAEQGFIRKQLEQMRNELNKEGKGQGNGLNPLIDELDKQEKDLINKNFTPGMIQRQRDIMTRLLESEKAMLERGEEERRESKEGKNQNFGNQILLDQYNKQKLAQIELLRIVDPVYNQYYKSRATQFFNAD